jgi:hypothetical protein
MSLKYPLEDIIPSSEYASAGACNIRSLITRHAISDSASMQLASVVLKRILKRVPLDLPAGDEIYLLRS